MTLRELQAIARNGDYFIAFTAGKKNQWQCQWIDVRRGLFQLGSKKTQCNVDGAPDAEVVPLSETEVVTRQ